MTAPVTAPGSPLRPARVPVPGASAEAGMSLVETLVAMTVLAVLLASFGATVRVMARTTIRTQAVADGATQARAAMQRLSRHLAYASAANTPVLVASPTGATSAGPAWYLELRSDVVRDGGVATCTQWRLLTGAQQLQVRSWGVASRPPTAWTTVARSVVNDPTAQPPFSVAGTDTSFSLLRVGVDLRLSNARGPVLQSQGQFSLRNSGEAPVPTSSAVCADPGTGVVDR